MSKKRKKYEGPIIDTVRASGRYDRSTDSLKKAVRSYIEKPGVSIHDGSEVSAEKREKALRQVAREKDWGLVTGDRSYRDDSYIMWDTKVWKALLKTTVPVKTGNIWTPKGSKMPDNAAALAVLEHRESGHRLVYMASHAPAGVEKGGRLARWTRRGAAWLIEVRDAKRIANRYAKKWNADGVVLSKDWNLDVKKAANRATIKAIMPTWKFGPRPPYASGGTLGNRWIDFLMFRRALRLHKRAWLMPDDASSDHRPSRTRLQFKKKPRNRR